MKYDDVRAAMDKYAELVGYDCAALRDFLREGGLTREGGEFWMRVAAGNSPAYMAETGERSAIWAYAASPTYDTAAGVSHKDAAELCAGRGSVGPGEEG